MNPRAVWAVAKAQFREFWRTPEAVFWAIDALGASALAPPSSSAAKVAE